MTREEVYHVIDSERAYQDAVWSTGGQKRAGHPVESGDGPNHTVGNFLTMLRHYLNQADSEWTTKCGSQAALHQLRKVAAICVSCFEQHGCPPRPER